MFLQAAENDGRKDAADALRHRQSKRNGNSYQILVAKRQDDEGLGAPSCPYCGDR
jgi:hypothetical protein